MVIAMETASHGSSEVSSDLVSLPPLAARAFSEPSPSSRSNTPNQGERMAPAEFSERAEPFYGRGLYLLPYMFSGSIYAVSAVAKEESLFSVAMHIK